MNTLSVYPAAQGIATTILSQVAAKTDRRKKQQDSQQTRKIQRPEDKSQIFVKFKGAVETWAQLSRSSRTKAIEKLRRQQQEEREKDKMLQGQGFLAALESNGAGTSSSHKEGKRN